MTNKFQERKSKEILLKKLSAEKMFGPNGIKSGNVAPPMVADQEVGSPHLFLTLCLIAQLKSLAQLTVLNSHEFA